MLQVQPLKKKKRKRFASVWASIQVCLSSLEDFRGTLVAQRVKNLVLSLLWLGLLCSSGSIPGQGNVCVPRVEPKKKEKVKGLKRPGIFLAAFLKS